MADILTTAIVAPATGDEERLQCKPRYRDRIADLVRIDSIRRDSALQETFAIGEERGR